MGIKQSYDKLPFPAKIVVGTVIFAGTAYLLYKGYRFIKKPEIESESKDLYKDNKQKLNKLSQIDKMEGKELSYTLSNYDDWANTLENEMNSMWGDKDKIYAIMDKLKNDRDFTQLYKSFGIRKKDRLFDSVKLDLKSYIDMYFIVYSKGKRKINDIFKKNGLTVRLK